MTAPDGSAPTAYGQTAHGPGQTPYSQGGPSQSPYGQAAHDQSPYGQSTFAPVPPQTGNPRIDEALGTLAAAGDGPPDQLVAPLTEADRALREALDSITDD